MVEVPWVGIGEGGMGIYSKLSRMEMGLQALTFSQLQLFHNSWRVYFNLSAGNLHELVVRLNYFFSTWFVETTGTSAW